MPRPSPPSPSSVEAVLAIGFASVPQVRHVLIEKADGPRLVRIAVDDPEPTVRRRIYRKELDLIEAFPETGFDFNLIPAMNRAAGEIATGAYVVYSRPE
jgi:hypothetical protein